jgi:GDPmannose 4,6-dehydratase
LGNLDAKRDSGHARDYAEAMWAMLQQDQPDDYVVATGRSHSVSEFVRSDSDFYRPAEVQILIENSAKAAGKLAWHPRTEFEGVVRQMVAADCESLGIDVPFTKPVDFEP